MPKKAIDGGAFKKWMVILFVGVTFYAANFGASTMKAYEVRTALREACQEKIKTVRYERNNQKWEKDLHNSLRVLGVPLTSNQWSVEVKQVSKDYRGHSDFDCRAKAVFNLKNEWFLIGDLFDIKPFKTRHNIDITVHYKGNY